MRAVEIYLAVLHDPTRLDPFFAALNQVLCTVRRLVRKDTERFIRLTVDMKTIHAKHTEDTDHVPKLPQGSASGVYHALKLLRIEYSVEDGVPHLGFPTGAKLPIDTEHASFFNTCIKEAAKYTLLRHLN